jgi:hypothetical protein
MVVSFLVLGNEKSALDHDGSGRFFLESWVLDGDVREGTHYREALIYQAGQWRCQEE